MTCCDGSFSAEGHFDAKKAASKMAQFREAGPDATTRLLEQGLAQTGMLRGRLLDIGSGVGASTFTLLDGGMSSAIAVDASTAYMAAAVEEARRRQRADVIQFLHGDFVDLASKVPAADVVTLDRVVCCYPLFSPLLEKSLDHAERCIALSYPRQVWFVRVGNAYDNGLRRLKKNPFRTFIHPVSDMRDLIARRGFDLAKRHETWTWCVDVYIRRAA